VAFVACEPSYAYLPVTNATVAVRDERIVRVADMVEEPVDPVVPEEHDATVPLTAPSGKSVDIKVHYARLPSRQSNAPVLLLLHGDSSSIHEFDELFPHLPSRFETFALDQPNNGRSGDIARDTVRALYPGDAYHAFEGLFFLRDAVAAFVRAVVVPAIGTRTVIVAGGSLGGTLGLFLVERHPGYVWLEEVFAWSPGSTWTDGGNKPLAAGVARKRADYVWKMPDEIDAFLASMFCQPAVNVAGLATAPPQPWFWYWDCWGNSDAKCGESTPRLSCNTAAYPKMTKLKSHRIELAYVALKSSVTAIRAQWHYEMTAEQIEFSQWGSTAGGKARYERIARDTTLREFDFIRRSRKKGDVRVGGLAHDHAL